MDNSSSIRPGSVIAGRYEILEPLGKGGMGMVYKAHDRVLDDTVAIKLLRSDVASEPEMARRFRSEIKLARKVRHRNVCGIHEYGEDGGLRFIAMEFIEGVDLRRVLTRSGAPLPEEAFEISIQLAQGLHAIHEAGIIHRDLKTPNIMRDSRGHVRLMDFGIAKQAGESAGVGVTALGMIVGTPEYMSPEQAFPGGRTPPTREARLRELLVEAEGLASSNRLAEAQKILREAVDVDPHSAVAFRRLFQVASALADQAEDGEK